MVNEEKSMYKKIFIASLLICFPLIIHAKIYCPSADDFEQHQPGNPWILKGNATDLQWRVSDSVKDSSLTKITPEMIAEAEIDECWRLGSLYGCTSNNVNYCYYKVDEKAIVTLININKNPPNLQSFSTTFQTHDYWTYRSHTCRTVAASPGDLCSWEWK
jgi:hypothetical protein